MAVLKAYLGARRRAEEEAKWRADMHAKVQQMMRR